MIGDFSLRSGNIDILPDDVRRVSSQRFAQDKSDTGIVPENDLDLIDYTDFGDLTKMLHARGTQFSSEFGCDTAALAARLEKMIPARNRVCHSRPLDEDDLPNFLDLAKDFLQDFKRLPWRELTRVQDTRRSDPSYVLRLEIPSFWRAGTDTIHHNLPLPDFDETSFLGRVSERSDVRKHLLGPHPVISIVGEGGVGKSALAIRCCYEILDMPDAPKYDAVVFVSLKTRTLTSAGTREIRDSITSTLGVVQSAADALGTTASAEASVDALANELLEYMEQFKVLLVIDNFETLASNSLRPLLSAVPVGSKVLITSRVGLGELEIRYKLDPLDEKTAIGLARRFSKCLNLELLSKASEARLGKYCTLLYKNPLLIKWFVQSVSSGADPDRLVTKGNQAFNDALRYCFENLYSRLADEEKNILHVLAAARRSLTLTELLFLLQQIGTQDDSTVQAALSTLHNSSMLKRMASDPRSSDAASQITLTDVSAEYLARFAPPERKFFDKVQLALKRLREMVELSAVQQAVYAYELMAIRTSTRDQRIAATLLRQAVDHLRTNDLDSARHKVNDAKSLLPGYAESYRIASIIETRAGDLYKAADEIETAIQYDPKSAVAHYQYAVFLLHEMEDSSQALIQIDFALSLDPKEETLETLRALALMRVGQCKESAKIYERLLDNLEVRPRKWRITTRDQASECYRRWAEQNVTMNDMGLAKEHLDRACHILEEAIGANEFDSRMGNLYTNIIEDAIGIAIQEKNADYAVSTLERLSEVNQAVSCAPFRRLTHDYFVRVFGEESQAVARAKQLSSRINWAVPRDTVAASHETLNSQQGKIKAMPVGMPYGFITDDHGNDWFFHKSTVLGINVWRTLHNGIAVVFKGFIEPDGKRRATHVELSKTS